MGVVRISEELLQYLDTAVETVKDEYGLPKYSSRTAVVNDAVKELMKKLGIEPKGGV